MLEYSFMQNAFIAGIIIAILCAIVSVFVVLRRMAFAAHALGHMGLTGASGAVLLGISPFLGQLWLNAIAGIVMGLMGDKLKKSDLTIGVVLSFILGLGAYFLFLFQNNYAGSVISILFGNIFAVSIYQVYQLGALAFIALIMLGFISRPLVFSSLDPVVAKSKNLPIKTLGILFFLILAISVSLACQIVGVLLVFVLLIIPGACGLTLAASIRGSIVISVICALFSVILALVIAYYANLPVSFCITMLLSLIYGVSLLVAKFF